MLRTNAPKCSRSRATSVSICSAVPCDHQFHISIRHIPDRAVQLANPGSVAPSSSENQPLAHARRTQSFAIQSACRPIHFGPAIIPRPPLLASHATKPPTPRKGNVDRLALTAATRYIPPSKKSFTWSIHASSIALHSRHCLMSRLRPPRPRRQRHAPLG